MTQEAKPYARRPGMPGLVVALLFVVAALRPMLAARATGIEPAAIAAEFAIALVPPAPAASA